MSGIGKAPKREDYFSLSEIARKFGVSADTIRRYGDEGIYRPRRIVNRRVLTRSDVEAIAAHRKRIKERVRNGMDVAI